MSSDAYDFTARVWLHDAGSWHFVSLPESCADDIADRHPRTGPGFGAVPVTVTVGGTTWSTSLFPDKARGTYLLPMKKAVLRAERIDAQDHVHVHLRTGRRPEHLRPNRS
ncbi:DUF1905 domain-containing protein [Nocardia rhizosphaerae]|uniref:DUF1905 domain-containing protein n=1 Tax=Nocardia rhizosphaerae TaxID=1691571 RepID=A0ABV8L4U0_9NOCA